MNFLQLFNISLVSESARSDFVDNQIIRLRAEQSSVSMELRLLRADLLQLSSFTLKYHDSIYLFYSAYSKTGGGPSGLQLLPTVTSSPNSREILSLKGIFTCLMSDRSNR